MNRAPGVENFTPTEAKVLIALVGRQHEPDREMAARLGMAPSNFAVVKKRLVAKGVLREVPSFNMSRIPEAKVAAFIWIEYNQALREKDSTALERRICAQLPVAHAFSGRDWMLYTTYFGTFEEAESARLRFSEFLQAEMGRYVANYNWKFVPLSHLRIYSFPSRLTKYSFTHEYERISDLGKAEIVEHASGGAVSKLNETERKVLIALRKYPGMRKGAIAGKVGIQQSSLSEVTKRLVHKGIIVTTSIPDPKLLPGRDMAAFSWIDLAQPIPEDEYEELIREAINKTPQLYRIYISRTFILIISMFHSLDKAETSDLSVLELFGSNLKALSFKVVPCRHLRLSYHSAFLEKLFSAAR